MNDNDWGENAVWLKGGDDWILNMETKTMIRLTLDEDDNIVKVEMHGNPETGISEEEWESIDWNLMVAKTKGALFQ